MSTADAGNAVQSNGNVPPQDGGGDAVVAGPPAMDTTSSGSFVAGLSLSNKYSTDAATLLQLARPDGYDFCVTTLPFFPLPSVESSAGSPTANAAISSSLPMSRGPLSDARSRTTMSAGLPFPRRDVTNLESKWWSTSIVGEVPANPWEDNLHHRPNERMNDVGSDTAMLSPDHSDGGDGNNKHFTIVKQLSSATMSDRSNAESTLQRMISWACHMAIPAVILPAPAVSQLLPDTKSNEINSNYARVLSTLAHTCSAANVQLWIRTPFTSDALHTFDIFYHRADCPSNLGCMLCFGKPAPVIGAGNGGGKTSAAAELAASYLLSTQGLLHKFIGCNLKAVSFDTSVFLTNKRGYPTLSKSYQILFAQLLRRIGRTVRVLVEGGQRHYPPLTADASGSINPNGLTGCLAYMQYLRHLRAKPDVVSCLDTLEADMENQYLDQLQAPLQPLADDLEFGTYETFEKDPVKYVNYQRAIEMAVRDKMLSGPLNNSQGARCEITIMVIGAGRGPLVHAALLAVDAVNAFSASSLGQSAPAVVITPHIFAIEKNPSAVLFLKSLLKFGGDLWSENFITLIDSDVRNLTPSVLANASPRRGGSNEPIQADIVVSELLGSFGDNELSPECLYEAEASGILSKECICIPSRYVSYVAPVSSMRLHAEARAQSYSAGNPTDGPCGQPYGTLRALETPYVVRTYAASQLYGEQPCFGFMHPGDGGNASIEVSSVNVTNELQGIKLSRNGNSKFARIEFYPDPTFGAGNGCGYGPFDSSVSIMAQTLPIDTPRGSSIHGFLGTFDALLYQSKADGTSCKISTAPRSFSPGMFSWFPLFFPLRHPIYVPPEAVLNVSFWRRSDSSMQKVWYEWCAEVVNTHGETISVSPIHNPNGRSSHVGL